MKAQLYFIYDCLCPWSFATTKLVQQVEQHLAETVEIVLLNNSRYENGELPTLSLVEQVKDIAQIDFPQSYIKLLETPQSSTLTANLMAWVSHKNPVDPLTLLTAIQAQLFANGQAISTPEDLAPIIEQFKLSPPGKVLKTDKNAKDATFDLGEIHAIQEIIGTESIPALLLANGEELVLLNHNLYLNEPKAIVEAINLELNK